MERKTTTDHYKNLFVLKIRTRVAKRQDIQWQKNINATRPAPPVRRVIPSDRGFASI